MSHPHLSLNLLLSHLIGPRYALDCISHSKKNIMYLLYGSVEVGVNVGLREKASVVAATEKHFTVTVNQVDVVRQVSRRLRPVNH